MRKTWREMDGFLRKFLTPAVKYILLTNIIVFFLFILLSPLSQTMDAFFFYLIQTPALAIQRFCIWQFATYMFMHAGFPHLLINMLVLWFFAPRLEYRWGTARFLRFYFIVGIGAGLFHTAVCYLTGRPEVGLLGASGAIYGIMLAYALYYPNDTVLLYFVIPVKIKYLVIFMGVLAFFSSFGVASAGRGGNISHITHLGGLVVALFYLKGGDWLRRKRSRRGPRVQRVNPGRHPDFR